MSQNTEPPTVKPRRAWIPALGLLLLAVVVAIVSWARQEPLPTPWALPPLPPEPLSAKYKETCLAFNSDSAPPSPRQLVELVQFFGDLDARLKTATPTAAPAGSQTPSANSFATSTGPIDTERLFQEAHRHGLIPASPYSDDPKFRAAMIGEIAPTGADWLEAMADVAHFRSVLITRVLPLEVATPTGTSVVPDGTVEVLVYLRRTDDWGGFGKERWWLRKSSIGWQIYDYENLYTGERLSQYIAILIADALKGSSSSVRILVGLGKSSQFMQEDAASAAKVLASIDPAPLPPAVRALYDYCAGAAALQRKDFAGARAQFDAALALKPDFAAALILHGECLNREGQFADAEAVAGQIEAQVGRDPHAAELRAAALIATGRTDGLADQFRTVLDFKPGDKSALNNLYDCLPAGQKGELVARFETCAKLLWQSQAPAVAELFASLASRLLKARDADTLSALVEAQAVRAPNDDWVLLYRVKAFQLRNQPQAVVDALKASLPGVKDAKIQALLADSRYQALALLKRAVEGYNGAAETDKPTAFRVMAEALQDAHDVDGMADLILA
ncbi:MAG TPA: tetratricopeptide repeat protein, partial [Planctomycetota bacterium]|nr:tetratricopeptide repeat protein [Planctomycetota bacterium]